MKNNRGYNNVINEEDIITFDRWEDMSLSKLRYVIKISYVDNKKNFCHAFNAKALYKLWKVNHYNDEIFKNPFSQKPFTEEDKNTILITLGKRDFRYDSDDNYTSAINARYDVVFNKSIIKINGINYWEIKISYLIKKGLRVYKSKSVIFEDMEDDIEEESESEDESLPGINLTEEDDKVSITDLDEQKPPTIELPVMVEEVEKNPLDEIDSKVEETNDETLVLSL